MFGERQTVYLPMRGCVIRTWQPLTALLSPPFAKHVRKAAVPLYLISLCPMAQLAKCVNTFAIFAKIGQENHTSPEGPRTLTETPQHDWSWDECVVRGSSEVEEKVVLKKQLNVTYPVHEIRKITTRYRLRSTVNLLLRHGGIGKCVRVHVECWKVEHKYPRVQRFRGIIHEPGIYGHRRAKRALTADCYLVTHAGKSTAADSRHDFPPL